MVVFTTEYRELAAHDRGNSLFRELLNSRIVISALRALLERSERVFPRDLHTIHVEWEPESRRYHSCTSRRAHVVPVGIDDREWVL